MTAHRAVIEAGPGTVRRLCCGGTEDVDEEVTQAALEAIDDPVALVSEQPVAVDSVWRAALRPLADGHRGPIILHPSWWSATRVGIVTSAARAVSADVTIRPRTWLLSQSVPDGSAATVVEVTERLVVVTGAQVAAVARRAASRPVAEDVADVAAGMARDVLLIDVPARVAGAAQLAASIAETVRRGTAGQRILQVDDARLARLARAAASVPGQPRAPCPSSSALGQRTRKLARVTAAGAALAVPVLALSAHAGTPAAPVPASTLGTAPTTVLLEGRVALTIPADWPTQRVLAGPGSARVQVTSPADPEVALHVTQSQVPGETLAGAAERLRRAIDAEPAGVFVDFDPAGVSAGRPAVTYREVRPGHDVRWTVLLDGSVRISVGCQSRPGAQDAVRGPCEQAVRSAHAIN